MEQTPLAILYCADDAVLNGIEAALAKDHIEVRPPDAVAKPVFEVPSVLVLDAKIAARASDANDLIGRLPEQVVVVAADEQVEQAIRSSRVMLTLPETGGPDARLRVLRAAYQLATARINAARAERELARSRNDLDQLHRIGMALMTERDPDMLLVRILQQARDLTHSDAGSLYLVELDDEGGRRLRFKL